MGYVQSRDGTNIFVKTAGAGPAVVLIHGWPLDSSSWEHQELALLEAGYKVISYDRRGFGKSDKPGTGYNYDNFADDLAAVIDDSGEGQVALAGFSMGGGEIARYLSRHGAAKVSKAALISSVVPFILKTDDNPDGVDYSVLSDMKAQIRKDRFKFLTGFAQMFYGVGWVTSPVSQEVLDWTFALAIQASPKATLDCVDAFGTTDFRPDLPSITVPTLIIHGTADKNVPIDPTGRSAARALPHATYIEYDGEPHGVFATVPERLNADLLSFLGQRR